MSLGPGPAQAAGLSRTGGHTIGNVTSGVRGRLGLSFPSFAERIASRQLRGTHLSRRPAFPFGVVISVIALAGCASQTVSQPASAAPSNFTTPGETLAAAPPDGSWQVDLTAAELVAAGAPADGAQGGIYVWTFEPGRARIEVESDGGGSVECVAHIEPAGDIVRFTYEAAGLCAGEVDSIRWTLAEDGLRLSLVDTTAPFAENKAYLEAKVWQPIDARPIPTAPPWQSQCELGCQGPVAPGTFTSADFLPGLTLTFTDETWFNTADHPDELEFDRTLNSNVLRFWHTAEASSETGEPLQDVPRTPSGMTDWFVGNGDMVVSPPEAVTIGDGIAATTFTLRISETNVNVDPGCPVRSCLNVLWINEGHVFAIGYGEAVRLFLFSIGTGSEAHTIVISLDAHDDSRLAVMTTDVAPILESIRLP